MINKQTTLDLNGPILSFTQQPSSVTVSSGSTTTFVGIATATYPIQDPINPAVNTGSIAYQWYVDGYGELSDGNISALGFSVTGSATTTLTVSNAVSPTANGRRFYVVADTVPSAYSQPPGSAVIAGTARSTGNASNDPKSSNTVTLTVRPILSVTSNPSNQEVAEGDFATFTASGSSNDGTAVSIRWLLNGSYLSDNGSTIFGSRTNTLRISLPTASANLVSAEISHPTASNSPLLSNSAIFRVVIARAIINYETFEDGATSIGFNGSVDLLEQSGKYFQFDPQNDYSSTSLYAPERDINVRVTLAGSAGGSSQFTSQRGGCGGVTVFDITLRKNIEYVLKIGSAFGLNDYPAGGPFNGGGQTIFYRQAQVIATSGGGGGAGFDGRGGDGGGAGQAGESGQGLKPGAGGRSVSTGSLGISGFWQGGLQISPLLPPPQVANTSPYGGKLSSCTIGSYWKDQGFSPCENMGNIQLYNYVGTIISGSAIIPRGFKTGLGYRNNGGVAPSNLNGAGGGGAYGGDASITQTSRFFSGGGGGSGYWNGEGTLQLAVRGGNCSIRGYVRIELITENTGIPSINPPPPDPPSPVCKETYYIYRYGGGGGFGSCPVGTIRRGRWYLSTTGQYYPIVWLLEGTMRTVNDILVSQTGVPGSLDVIEAYIRYYNAFGEAEFRRFIGGSGPTTTPIITFCGKSYTDPGDAPPTQVDCEPGDGNNPSELYQIRGPFTT